LSFFEELKRRHVFKVGVAYLIIAWLIAQVLELVFSTFGMPPWMMKAVLLLLAAGFVISLVLAWAYELTPDGIKKDSEAAQIDSGSGKSSQKMNYIIIAVLAVAASYLFITKERSATEQEPGIDALVARPSVIVLPFANISGDETQEYLAFGITDELIAGLQRLGNFPVVSRHVSLSYGVTDVSAVDFAQNHGAAYLVEGSVNVGADGIRILANLSSSAGNQVWAERYKLEEGQVDVFDVSDELVSKVAGAVLESEVKRVQREDRPPSDAWEHYMKGLSVVLEYDHEKYEMARRHLDRAVEIAPDMAEAWWALGELEIMNYLTRPLIQHEKFDDLNEYIEYFRKAHEISPFHAAACGCLGYMLTAVGRPEEARIVYEEAIEAKPLSPDWRVDYAIYLAWVGRYEEALENAALSLKLGPVSQDQAGVWTVRSLVAFAQGDDQAALDAVNRAMFINKGTFYTPAAVAMLYVLGQHEEAVKLLVDMQSLFPGLQPRNPVFYVTLKPIDDVLKARHEQGEFDGPVDVEEVYSILRKAID
jgi:TolB-like protein/tetratricopeptide (TPR) repeat protein